MDERRYADQEMRYSKVRTDYMKYVAHTYIYGAKYYSC